MRFVRTIGLAMFALALCMATPSPAQQSTAEGLSETALSRLSDAQSIAQQLAQQQGQFAGRSIGPQFASATNQLLQVLTNFDIWACGVSVTALHLKRQRLAVAAAGMQPPDPALDKAVDDFGRAISLLQELCDRHVHRIYGDPAGGGGGSGTTGGGGADPPPTVEEPPRMSVQERICHDRCGDLYNQFVRAEFEYDRARRDAERDRQRANERRREADQAAERARSARQQAEQSQRDFDRLQGEMRAARTQAERLRIADQLARLYPESMRQRANQAQQEADEAARRAQEAEARAARSETQANALYDAMIEIYEAWLRCIQTCVEQARLYNRVTIDPYDVFPGMPRSPPRRPPFYRPAPPPRAQVPTSAPLREQQASLPRDAFSARILQIHNSERAAVGAPPLRWNRALEASATAHAQHLAQIGRLEHASRVGRGIERENLQKARIGWSADRMMQDWVAEKRAFRPGLFPNVCAGDWSRCAHYTQVIWPTTTDVGCGRARGRGFEWFVCRYSPGGNKDGQPVGVRPQRPERGR